MRRPAGLLVPALGSALLLAGCSTAPAPRATVTVTVAAPRPSLRAGDGAAWDLSALCAAESELHTVEMWRRQQLEAKRLSPAEAKVVAQSVAVQALELDHGSLPASIKDDVQVVSGAAGSLADPSLDLSSAAVDRAQTHISQVCQDAGLTIGVIAQGG